MIRDWWKEDRKKEKRVGQVGEGEVMGGRGRLVGGGRRERKAQRKDWEADEGGERTFTRNEREPIVP